MRNYKVKLYKTEDISINPDRDYLGDIIVEQRALVFFEATLMCKVDLIPHIRGEGALFSFTRINLEDLEENGYFLYIDGHDVCKENEVSREEVKLYKEEFENLEFKKYLNGEKKQAYQKSKAGRRHGLY